MRSQHKVEARSVLLIWDPEVGIGAVATWKGQHVGIGRTAVKE